MTLFVAGVAAFAVFAAYLLWRVFLQGERVGEVVAWRDSISPTRRTVRLVVAREEGPAGVRVHVKVRVSMAACAQTLTAEQARAFAALLEDVAQGTPAP